MAVLQLQEGDQFPANAKVVEEKLKKVPGVKRANVTKICCELGEQILFVGVSESDADTIKWKTIKGRAYHLPDSLFNTYTQFAVAWQNAVVKGNNADDLSEGHSLFKDLSVRKFQLEFKQLAEIHFNELKKVLLCSNLPDQRAAAATIIAYANNKQKVAKVLNMTTIDPSAVVRNNVFRALTGLAVYQQLHPNIKMEIDYQLFPKMLNSVYWSDRDKGIFVLLALTESRNQQLLKQLRADSMVSLIEMAQWKSSAHAMLAYIILGRIMDVPEATIYQTWVGNQRSQLIEKANKSMF